MPGHDPDALALIGARIRSNREYLGIKQTTLAKQLMVSQPAVSQWERGVKLPALPMQFQLADALRTERSKLFAEITGRAA